MKHGVGSLVGHGGVTAWATRDSVVGRPGPNPRGHDPLPCLDFNTPVNTIGFGNVRAQHVP